MRWGMRVWCWHLYHHCLIFDGAWRVPMKFAEDAEMVGEEVIVRADEAHWLVEAVFARVFDLDLFGLAHKNEINGEGIMRRDTGQRAIGGARIAYQRILHATF